MYNLKTKRIYIYPKLSEFCGLGIRLGGPGLGNCLFIIARALILEKSYGFKLINPDWISIKIGPLLRGELDKRFYVGFFNPIGLIGISKLFPQIFFKKINEKDFHKEGLVKSTVIIIKEIGKYFEDIRFHRTYVTNRILSSIQEANYDLINQFDGNCIGIHVRRGDFKSEWQIPIEWFIITINKIRSLLKKEVKVCIFSDGSDDQIKSILNLENVERIYINNALIELVCLSKCEIILASNSTFSAWAVFLGDKPSIWKKQAKEFNNLLLNEKKFGEIVDEEKEFPPLLISNLREAFCAE